MRQVLLFCVFSLSALSEAFKILVYSPSISKSHVLSNARIADTLSQAGHNVTMVEPEYRIPASSVKTQNLARRIVLSNITHEYYESLRRNLANNIFFAPQHSLPIALLRGPHPFFAAGYNTCDDMLTNYREFWLSLRADEFDIFMTEQVDMCGPALKHLIGAKSLIWISSTPLLESMAGIIGLPSPASFVPSSGSQFFEVSDQMTMYQRLRNLIEHYNSHLTLDISITHTDAIMRRHFGQDFPSVRDILQELALIFVLADEFLTFPRPVLHNVVYVGGAGMDLDKQELPAAYQSEMENGKKGVVLFSMGSVVQTRFVCPTTFKKHVVETFASLPDYHFLVKIDEDDAEFANLVASVPNIKAASWLPQPAILAHDRLKLFITHGGYNSLLETVHAGKPVLLLPFFADQWTNGRLAERNHFGRVFDKRLLLTSTEEFRQALIDTLNDESLPKHAIRIRKLIQSKPMTATERLLAYTNFVGENRDFPELHVSGRKLSTLVYYNLDILIIISLVVIALSVLVIVVVVGLIRRLLRRRSKKTPKVDRKKID